MSDKTTSSTDPMGAVKRLRDVTDRTLSEEFHTRSPNTQMHIKDMTGGTTPTSQSKKKRMTVIRGSQGTADKNVATDAETSEERFNLASDFEKEMMFRHGLIPPNCTAYREYEQKHAKTT